jgi:MYXO-CTERM domain-containing protein
LLLVSIALAVGVVGLTPHRASAHGALPTIFEIAEADGEIIGLGATFGLLLRGPDDRFRWACEDVLGTPVSGYVIRSPDDVVAVTRAGVWRTEDGGCSYTSVETSIGELPISEVRNEAGVSYVATASLSVPNGVFRSDDAGLTWTRVGPEFDGVALFGLAISDGRIVVSGLSADAGWVVYEWSEDGPEPIAPLPEGTLDAEVWLVGGTVWVADIVATRSSLYEIVDGAVFARTGEINGVVTDLIEEDGRILVATDTNMIFEVSGTGLVQLEGEVGTCFVTLEDGTPARCGSPVGEYSVLTGRVGETIPILQYDEIVANPCVLEEGHPCEPIWIFAARLFGASGDEPEDPPVDGGCAVARGSDASAAAGGLVVGAAFFWRRRRSRYSASQISVSSRSARSC